MKEKRKRRKLPIVLLSVFGVIVIAVSVVAVLQWNNVQAFIAFRRYSTIELEQKITDNDARTELILDKLPHINVRPLTEGEKEKLHSGDLTHDDAVRLIMKPLPRITIEDDAIPESSEPELPETPEPTETPEAPVVDEKLERIAELIAEIYVLRETMTGRLDGILQSAKSEYGSLRKEERTDSKKQDMAVKYFNEASDLEYACDTQMNNILTELYTLLKEKGGDTGIVAEIRQAYTDEKYLKKSYYLSQYS